ncbi:amidohydrolase [Gregarina niphandrodes]|uniref:Amidohydrolase n=1 Tax=Gregarina niphandrodes TaxID=110365 RepID=A0A023B792_GRENI|nr:amidohydrolase [Gregarina niphandrodes]EZG67099.1 amidohydrolase [Gregarina niphandrodes]|eukprot:XP_011130331.1 amidohydrolase [Gregarina niphandrodes]
MNDDEVRQMVENKRISVPTLIMLESVCQMKGIDQERPGFAFANALKTVMCCTMRVTRDSSWHESASGTGVARKLWAVHKGGSSVGDDTLVHYFGRHTTLPAHYFGLKDRGVIKLGYRADLVLIDGNPIDDIKATRSIKKVWVAGQGFVPSTTK